MKRTKRYTCLGLILALCVMISAFPVYAQNGDMKASPREIRVFGGYATDTDGTAITQAYAGQTVVLHADPPQNGEVFEQWYVMGEPGIVFDDPTASRTSFVMPDQNVVIEAGYVTVWTPRILTVAGGYAANSQGEEITQALPGETVWLIADEAEFGWEFMCWDISGAAELDIENYGLPEISFTMPDADLMVFAYYWEADKLPVTDPVVNICGYYLGANLDCLQAKTSAGFRVSGYQIVADQNGEPGTQALSGTVGSGKYYWMVMTLEPVFGYTLEELTVADFRCPGSTALRLGETDLMGNRVLSAKLPLARRLNLGSILVENGTAYVNNTPVNAAMWDVTIGLQPADMPEGMAFDHWEVVSGNITLADPTDPQTTFTMGTASVELRAVFKTVYTVLRENTQVALSLTEDLYIDLNGFDFSGTIITNGYQVYGMDRATDDYDLRNLETGLVELGHFSCVDENGAPIVPVSHFQSEITGEERIWVTVATDGGYSFHRLFLDITQLTLAPNADGFGYKAEFYGDEMVQEQIAAIGYDLWIDLDRVVSKTTAYQENLTLRLKNFPVASYGETPVNAQVTVTLTDGTVLKSETVSVSLRTMVEMLNAEYGWGDLDLTQAQLTAVRNMIERHPVMESWDIAGLV